jgi:DNA polymerase elongation subunit (family B)
MRQYINVYSSGAAHIGTQMFCREVNNGVKNDFVEKYESSLFVKSPQGDWRSIEGTPLKQISFESRSEVRDFIEKYESVTGFEIHGEIGTEYQFIRETYDGQYKVSDVDVAYFDIETTAENGFPSFENPIEEILAITITRRGQKPYVFCRGEYKAQADEVVFSHPDEREVLLAFLKYFSDDYPHVLTGWNIRFFDIPYLYNRMLVVLGKNKTKDLSPWGIIRDKTVSDKNGKDKTVYDIIGISTLDYYELYQKFTYVNRESYRLDYIAYVELGERKISYSEYESIQEFYTKDFQKFIEYNIQDVRLVERLEDRLKLIELALALAYSAGVNFTDVFSQVKTWDVIIYNHLAKNKIAIPPKGKASKDEQYAGAYVKDPIVGMHKWIVSFDLNSLYPHLIMQYNISPETITDDGMRGVISPDGILSNGEVSMNFIRMFTDKNLSVAANGTTFVKDRRGFLPELMDKMYQDRKMFKHKMIECQKELEKVVAVMKTRGIL